MKMKIITNQGVTAPLGFKAAGVACGIKTSGKKDMAIVHSEVPAKVAAAFTSNRVVAAPVTVCRELIGSNSTTQAIVINSGNANACTGKQGYLDALEMSRLAAAELDLKSNVPVASTGIIGDTLPMDKVRAGIKLAAADLSAEGGVDAANAIMTTDAFSKEAAAETEIDGKTVRIGGMAKGAGMIAPQLVPHATMIAVVTTDAAVKPELLRRSLISAVNRSFNRSTVDGDTSTNDSAFLLANGLAGNTELGLNSPAADLEKFQKALDYVMIELAKMIVKDGEGATKLISYKITRAKTEADAVNIGMTIANSPLVKTAFFGGDPNWGRILMAAGKAGSDLEPERIALYFGDEQVVKEGKKMAYDKQKVAQILAAPEIDVTLDLDMGDSEAVCFGSDLSYEYIRINAEYRT